MRGGMEGGREGGREGGKGGMEGGREGREGATLFRQCNPFNREWWYP